MSEEFDSITEVPVDEQLINALNEAGASGLLIDMVRADPEEVGVERNSVRNEVRKYCYWEGEVSAYAIESNKNLGGGFFQAVWSGSLQDAEFRADSNNKKILEYVKGGKSNGLVTA